MAVILDFLATLRSRLSRLSRRSWMIAAGVTLLALVAAALGGSLLGSRPPADRAALLGLIDEARDSMAGPGLTVVEAAGTLGTPDAALVFVREQVGLSGYRYRRLDPQAALGFRTANPLDKAVLLAGLIQAQGYETRIRSAPWPEGVEPDRPRAAPPTAEFRALTRALGVGGRDPGIDADRATAMTAAVDGASAALEPLIPQPRSIGGWRNFRDRYWVEARKSGEDWKAYDPLFGDQPTDQGSVYYPEPVRPVKIELLAEDQRGVRQSLLRWEGPITGDISLSYLPAVGARAWLESDAEPEAVPLWIPVLASGGAAVAGRPFAPDGSAPPAGSDGRPLFAEDEPAISPPTIRSMRIEEIDTSRYPRVSALISTESDGSVPWRASFLQLADNGNPARVRIESQPASVYGGRTIVFVIDNSGSMHDDFDRVRPIVFDLIDRLGPGVRVGVTHTEASGRLMIPPRLLTDKAALKRDIDAVLKPGGSNRELEAVQTALREVSTPVDIVLIGDGELRTPRDGQAIREAVAQRQSRVYAIYVAGSPSLYQTFSDAVWSALPGQLPESLTAQLAGSFSDRMRISWEAEGGPERARAVTITSSGWTGGTARARYTPRAEPDATRVETQLGPGLILSLDMSEGGERQLRRIVPLEGDDPARALRSATRIMPVPGIAPDATVMALSLDEWSRLGHGQAGRAASLPARSGPSFWTLARGNALMRHAMAAYGGGLIAEQPLILVESVTLVDKGGGRGALARRFDLLNPAVISPLMEEARPWRVGLAVAAAEGALLDVEGVASPIVSAARPLVVADPARLPPPLDRSPEARSILSSGRYLFVTAPGAGARAWLLERPGRSEYPARLEARLFDPAAKGVNAEEALAGFQGLKGNLTRAGLYNSALASAYGIPGAPLGAIVGLLEQNRRLWCYSSVMMGYVNDEIAGTLEPDEADASVWKAKASEGCEIDVDRLTEGYLNNMTTGFVSNALSDQVSGAFGWAWYNGTGEVASPFVNFFVGYGVSAGFEYGGLNQELGDVFQF